MSAAQVCLSSESSGSLFLTGDELFAIDAQARERNLTVTERDRLRQQRARPILESIKSQIEAARSQTLPKSLNERRKRDRE